MKVFRILSFLAMMLACAMLQAQGIVVVQQQTSNGQTSTSQIQLDKTHIRAESRASGESMAFLFDEAAQTARVLNLDKKTYMEMNAAMSRQVQQQLAQVQAQLQNLPPEQRAALEQALRARGGLPGGFAARGAKLEYRRSGSDKVGKWACTKYEGYQAQQKVIELCTIDPKELGLTIADFEVATHLVEFLQGFLPQAAGQIVVAGTASEQGFSGIPVRRTTFTDGRVDTVTETKEIRREAIPAAAFEVPAGFKREDPMR